MKQHSIRQKTVKIATTGIAAAIIFAVTYFLRIPVPMPGGAYINLGDSAIFIMAFLTVGTRQQASRELHSEHSLVANAVESDRDYELNSRTARGGFPAACLPAACLPAACVPAAFAAAIGSAFADLAAGAPIYIPATFIIKGIMGFLFGKIYGKGENFKTYIFAAVICGAVMIVGYFLYEMVVFSVTYALSSVPFNVIQAVGSVAVSAVIYKPIAGIKVRRSDF
jgi:uncharacterized membrane protein